MDFGPLGISFLGCWRCLPQLPAAIFGNVCWTPLEAKEGKEGREEMRGNVAIESTTAQREVFLRLKEC